MTVYYKKITDGLFNILDEAEKMIQSAHKEPQSVSECNILLTGSIYRKLTEDKAIYKVNIAGAKKENINISIQNNKLIFDIRERNVGSKDNVLFLKETTLYNKCNINGEIQSTYVDGILEVSIPFVKPQTQNTIHVKVN